MDLIGHQFNFDFMKHRFLFIGLSAVVLAIAGWGWVKTGQSKYGIDFLGGTEIVVRYSAADSPEASKSAGDTKIEEVRAAVEKLALTDLSVQQLEGAKNEFVVRVASAATPDDAATAGEKTAEMVGEALKSIPGRKAEILKQDFVGPVMGNQIRRDGIKALVFGLLAVLLYVTIRFEFRFAMGAIIAVIHDAVIAAGLFVLMGGQLSSAVIAALLTIIGYSVNDTIVIYDRVRENMINDQKKGGVAKGKSHYENFIQLINASLNQTLSRTILTSFATLLLVTVLFIKGGGVIHDIAHVLLIGMIAGIYSTIFIASPVVIAMGKEAPKLRGA